MDGKYFYAGWFHFVGSNLIGRDSTVKLTETSGTMDLENVTPGFWLGLTADLALVPSSMKDCPLLQLEFEAHVPWVLDEPYPK